MNAQLDHAGTALAGKYLTIAAGGELFGIGIQSVREIVRLQKITAVPGLPPESKGVINLRGRVIPVLDLRTKFGMAATFLERTCIVVVQAAAKGGRAAPQVGIVVDRVEEVVTFNPDQLEPAAAVGGYQEQGFLLGLGKVREQVVMLLDLRGLVNEFAAGGRPTLPTAQV